jgi:uncharacterized protein (DUF2141 family)
MFKNLYKTLLFFGIVAMLLNCANRGTPSGGEIDIEAPIITKSEPENFTTNFTGNEIKIYFNEYIKVKDIQKQLIISPPMNNEPEIIPMGSASKYISIKIKDTLQPNTTYAFNFGNSIVDNNEENPYPYYRYVFSTGSYIDSLSVKGNILDARERVVDKFVTVMLYDVDSTFTDSIVYQKKPKYVTNTLDSTTTFSIDNIKEGKYLLVALKDGNSNYTFQPKTDKIAFHNEVITVPSDSTYTLKLFNEELDFDVKRPFQAAGQKIAFGFEGDYKSTDIQIQSATPEGFEKRITKDAKTDTLYYWHKPKLEIDSSFFVIKNKKFTDTVLHRFRDLKQDTLVIKSLQSGSIDFDEDFQLEGSIPFEKLDVSQIKIMDKDSADVAFTTEMDTIFNRYKFKFEKKESQTYKVQILPNAITDFFGNVNDTLDYTLRTKLFSEYANVRVILKNAVYPIIVQLTDDKGEMKYEQFATEPKIFDFTHITTGNYYLKIIFDTNGNQKWDSGNYLKKLQPERISYDLVVIEASANWDVVQEFTLE